jgi:hypothetical protein
LAGGLSALGPEESTGRWKSRSFRLDFPPEHRDVAQQIAAGLAEIVGMKIKQLKPQHNLSQIAEWADNGNLREGFDHAVFGRLRRQMRFPIRRLAI